MPELPEVEVTRRGLLAHLPRRRITAVDWSDKRLRKPIPHQLLTKWIQGDVIRTVDRRAKYLLIRMARGAVLVVHLGMSGRLGIFPAHAPRAKHDHLLLALDNDMEIRFNDTRRFGMVLVWPPDQVEQLYLDFFSNTGPDPFDDECTAAWLQQRAAKRRQPVKMLLMDQKIVAGIGNIYANEILFAVALSPDTPACTIGKQTWQSIIDQSRKILTAAISSGGTTISDFLGSSGKPGYFQLQLRVYNRLGESCDTCSTTIEKKTFGGRATYYCPKCQSTSKS